jgi:anti-sigma regulatory factor (Ser/Thr protein kinase)
LPTSSRKRAAVIAKPAHPAYIQAVLDFAETLSEGLGFVQRERQHIRLAVEEIIAFIGHTAFAGLNLSPLSMTFEPRADGLAIRLVAQGLPLDVEHMPEYNPADAAAFAPDGLSPFLAKKVMDQVVFTIADGRLGGGIASGVPPRM